MQREPRSARSRARERCRGVSADLELSRRTARWWAGRSGQDARIFRVPREIRGVPMMNFPEKTITSRVLVGSIFAAALAVSPLALAHGGGGSGGGGGMSGVHGDFGGSSMDH